MPPTSAPPPRLLTTQAEGVLTLTLSNPSARNALHPDIYTAGIKALEAATQDANVGAIILNGEGKHFCAGGNLSRLAANRLQGPDTQRSSLALFHQWIQALRACPKPIIAAIEGHAAGAGFSLALACDLIIAADDAQFSMAYVKVGLSPDGGASAHIVHSLPRQLAYELLALGDAISSQRLYSLGLITRLTASGLALSTAQETAIRLANGARQAQKRIKHLLNHAPANPLATQLDAEADAFIDSLFGPEAEEGIQAFLNKRTPDFKSVMP